MNNITFKMIRFIKSVTNLESNNGVQERLGVEQIAEFIQLILEMLQDQNVTNELSKEEIRKFILLLSNSLSKENTRKLMDFYEITMAYSDFKDGKYKENAYFDVFFRKNLDNGGYNISGGLDEIINSVKNFRFNESDIEYLRTYNLFDEEFLEYLKNFKFKGNIYAIPDGTAIFANEPCITVYGNTIEAQIIETDILNKFNHGSLITTKARRIVNEAKGKPVLEFGARRAQGSDAAINGAKYAYIGGCAGTSCYEAGKKYGIPLLGTMAHSHVEKYNNEYEAFLAFAKALPDNFMPILDTIDTLKSGVPNAIKVALDYLLPNGHRLKGGRLDSGEMAELSIESREQFNNTGFIDAGICASGGLDEYSIKELNDQEAPVDSFGVGENLITSKSCPIFGGVYKLVALQNEKGLIPKIKISDTPEKTINPGYKRVYRLYDNKTGQALRDVIALADEAIPEDRYVTSEGVLTDYTVKELQVPIFINGELVYQEPTIKERRERCEQQVHTLAEETLRLYNPVQYPVDLTMKLLKLKRDMIVELKGVVPEEIAPQLKKVL